MLVKVNGKIVGHIKNEYYISHRDTRKHFFVIGQGYGISSELIPYFESKGVKEVIIIENGAKGIRKFQTSLENYKFSKEYQMPGFEKQKCYPLKLMKQIR